MPIANKPHLEPISQALKRIKFWLGQDELSRLIVAAPTVKELKQQNQLPSRLRTSPKKRRGSRKALRGRRHYQEPLLTTARWPQDGLDENALPSLACVLSGEADLNIADYVLHCTAGDWIFFPAGIPKQDGSKSHFEGDTTGRKCDILWLCTERTQTDGLRCWICHSEENIHIPAVEEGICWVENRLLPQLFNGFCEEVQTLRRFPIMLALLNAMTLLLASEIEAGRISAKWGQRRYADAVKQLDLMEEALKYMEDHLDQPLTIDIVARAMLVSRATFTRHFREHTGQSFHEYHTQMRMQRATKQLKETNLPVAVICKQVGLQYGQLRALFQKTYDCSPGKFRNQKK